MTAQFQIFCVVLFALTSLVAGLQLNNIALGKDADQSSGIYPFKAIDGIKYHEFHFNSCSLTNEEDDPWWRVDLGAKTKIFSVIITSSDQGHYYLSGIEIWIDGTSVVASGAKCGVIDDFGASQSKYLSCSGVKGQYVTLRLPGVNRTLSLCEVQVFSADLTSRQSNLAAKGEAVQSSTLFPAGASRANDGKRLTYYTEGSCSHTAERETGPWWRVDLHQSYIISEVKITNRGDCCPERLDGAEIRIGNSLDNNGNNNDRCTTITHIPNGNTFTFTCDSGTMEGRYVNVVIPGENKTLTLCEVEVYGNPEVVVAPLDEVAVWKHAGQSSTWGHYAHHVWYHAEAYKAVHWCQEHTFNHGCCIQTYPEHRPWWMVDLGSEHRVTAVVIYNRADVAANLVGAKIKIGNSGDYRHNPKCAVISSPDLKQTFYCFEMVGRYVSVNIFNEHPRSLSFCRLEVYASPVVPELVVSLITTPAPTMATYPSESAEIGGRTVFLIGQKLCWSDALFYCRHHHWDLFSVHGPNEQAQVEELLRNSAYSLTENVWLGLRREVIGMHWFWMSGDAVTYDKWRLYPIMFPNSCGAMERDGGLWIPLSCGEANHFLCQTDPGLSTTKVYYYSSKVKIV